MSAHLGKMLIAFFAILFLPDRTQDDATDRSYESQLSRIHDSYTLSEFFSRNRRGKNAHHTCSTPPDANETGDANSTSNFSSPRARCEHVLLSTSPQRYPPSRVSKTVENNPPQSSTSGSHPRVIVFKHIAVSQKIAVSRPNSPLELNSYFAVGRPAPFHPANPSASSTMSPSQPLSTSHCAARLERTPA